MDIYRIYEKYEEWLDIGRTYLYHKIDDIIRIAFSRLWFSMEITDDLRSCVILLLDEKILAKKGSLILWTLNAIRSYLWENCNWFIRVPVNKIQQKLSCYRLMSDWDNLETENNEFISDIDDWEYQKMKEEINYRYSIDMVKKLMEKNLKKVPRIIIETIYFWDKTIPTVSKYKYLSKKLYLSESSIRDIENNALNILIKHIKDDWFGFEDFTERRLWSRKNRRNKPWGVPTMPKEIQRGRIRSDRRTEILNNSRWNAERLSNEQEAL